MYQKITLDNGLRIVLVPKKESKTVAVLVLIKSGTDYETKEIKGIYHFIEHLPFKGTEKRRTAKEISQTIEGKGGALNAFTEPEITGFMVKMSSGHLETALDVLSDMLLSPLFEPKEINKEARVVIQEINSEKDNPQEHLEQVLWGEVVYGDQPAGWPILGTKESVKAVNRAKIIKHFGDRFRTKGIVISIAGNFKAEEAENLVKNYFNRMNKGLGPQKPKVNDSQDTPQILVSYKRTEQTHFSLGVRAPSFNLFSPKRHVLFLISTILGGNMSSRLFVSVRERRGLAYHIHTEINLYTDRGWLVTDAGVDHKKVEEVIYSILTEYQKITQKIVAAEELERAKEYLKGKMIMQLDDLIDTAYFHGGQELLLNRILTPEEEIEDCLRVTPEEIQRVAKKIFQPQNLNLALIGPFKSEKRFSKILENWMR